VTPPHGSHSHLVPSDIILDFIYSVNYIVNMNPEGKNQYTMSDYRHITEEALSLWSDELYSLAMIGRVFGVSRVAVRKFLRRRGIDTSKGGTEYSMPCKWCGVVVRMNRARLRSVRESGRGVYCSRKCYYDSVRGEG